MIPYGRQQIDEADITAVVDVLRSDYLTTGPTVERFETALAEVTGARHVVACANGTAALHLSAMSLCLGPGDGVIVPAVTFLATANAVRYTGAEVIFSDVDPETGLMGPEHLTEALTRADNLTPRAVFPVDLNGQCVDMVAVATIADRHDLAVVMDSCHAIGGRYSASNGNLVPVGSCQHAVMTCFSFHPVKTVTMGEGGAVMTNDSALAARLQRLRNHGMVREPQEFTEHEQAFASDTSPLPWYYEMPEIGYNYRASDLHCALGISQLTKLNRFVARRQQLVGIYDQMLAPLTPEVQLPARVAGCEPAWHLYAVRINYTAIGKDRSTIVRKLYDRGIGTQVHYLPVNRQPYYRNRYGLQKLSGADKYYEQALSLPLFPGMSDEDVEYVVNTLIDVIGER